MKRKSNHPDEVAERQQRAAELTEKGWTAQRIADELGVTPRAVQRHRRAAGLTQPWTPLPESVVVAAQQMLADGASYQETAETLGCSANAIARRFPGQGWQRDQIAQFSAFMRRMKKAGMA